MTYAQNVAEQISNFLNENLSERQRRILKIAIILIVAFVLIYLTIKNRAKIVAFLKRNKKIIALSMIALIAVAAVKIVRKRQAKA